MNSLVRQKTHLPVKINELVKFVLIGREKLVAIRAQIRAIDKLDLATGVRKQKKEEATMLAGALLDAEARIGDLLSETEHRGGSATAGTSHPLPKGINKKQSHIFQTLADHPEVIEQVKAEAKENDDLPTRTEVLRIIKENEREEHKKNLKAPKIPEGKYNVIYADPPWTYRNTGVEGAVDKEYPTMTIDELCKMPIKELLPQNAVLFLWVTNPILEECFPVIKSWDFSYKTNFCWFKKNKKTGIGFYVRGIHELLLICIKGQMLPVFTPLSVIEMDAKEHSRKPDIYNLIEKMYPNCKYLELFHRGAKRKGWTQWGEQSE